MAREPEAVTELRRVLGEKLAAFRKSVGLTQADLAAKVFCDRTTIAHIEKGRSRAEDSFWKTADRATGADGALMAIFNRLEALRQEYELRDRQAVLTAARAKANEVGSISPTEWQSSLAAYDDDLAAIELSRRVVASDVGNETLIQIEAAFDDLATAYPVTLPSILLPRLRQQLAYVTTLLDARKTLAEHRRLLIVGGWLSLLAATVHIDLNQQSAASARLRAASILAKDAEFNEIRAWCFETEAWRVLTDGKYQRAVELSKAAQQLAPTGSSVAIQATAQEGRAWARLGQAKETYAAIDRVHNLVAPTAKPERAEHHYRYDPDKSVAYTATTLAWAGDVAAETYAREVIARLKPSDDVGKWPRRVASANLDLALTLIVGDRLDEACHAARQAINSGRIVPSNHWRAAEVVAAVEARKLHEAKELRDAYETMRHPAPHTA